ncbi:MAG: tail fiber domain-containing protein [Ferruginibacter sp.]
MKTFINKLAVKKILIGAFFISFSLCSKAQFDITTTPNPFPGASVTVPAVGYTNLTTLPLHIHSYYSPGGAINHPVYVGHGNWLNYLNTAVGEGALGNLNSAPPYPGPYGNTALGYNALNQSSMAKSSVAVGTQALEFGGDFSNNVCVGYFSGKGTLANPNTGSNNTGVGFVTLSQNMDGHDNTAIGYGSMGVNHHGNFNTALGTQSLGVFDSGDDNIALGRTSASTLTSGNRNIAIGGSALAFQHTGDNNVGIGHLARVLDNTNDQLSIQNTIFGLGMGTGSPLIGINTNPVFGNSPTATFDINGTARIRQIPNVLYDHILCVDGLGNVNWRDVSTIGGGSGTCTWSLGANPDNVHTANGLACRKGFASIGIDDVGANGLLSNATAKLYVFKEKRDKDGYYTIGTYSQGKEETRGVGVMGYGNSKNEGIGVYGMTNFVCDEVEDIKRNIAVYGGPNVDGWKDCDHPHGFWASYFAGPQISINDPILISDARVKKDVAEINNADEIISKLNPKTYFFRHDVEKGFVFTDKRQYGFISQDVEKVLPELVHDIPGPVTPDEKGNLVASKETYKGIAYDELIAVLVKAVQNQNDKISELQSQVNALSQGSTASKSNTQTVILNDDNVQQVVLYQNVPNPFAEKTTIAYQIPNNAKNAEIRFYNAGGSLVKAAQLVNKGKNSIEVFGSGVSGGIYTYVLYVDGKAVANKKMVKL